MSATHHAHAYLRTSSSHVRKPTTRASRPAPSSKSAGLSKATLKGTKGKPREEQEEIVSAEDDDDMGSSFLQFCATCEKQILVPNNSILYCSESCRRKDGFPPSASSPYHSLPNPTPSPFTTGEDSEDSVGLKAHNINLRQQATDLCLFTRIPPMAHDGKSDLDPSEWKPNLPDRSNSDAFHYLSQFHRSSTSLIPNRRPALQSRSTTTSVAITTPSLSHTPTTNTSSDVSLAGTPYEFVNRPLLPRHDPTYSVSAGMKSIELVIPCIPSAFSVPESGVATDPKLPSTDTKCQVASTVIEDDDKFRKKYVVGSHGHAAGSLKKLLELRT